jgi:hypothetical protein
VGAVPRASNVVAHECGDENGADQLNDVNEILLTVMIRHTCQARRPMETALDTILLMYMWKMWWLGLY